MNKPSVRLTLLVRSVKRLLDDGEEVRSVAMMFTRHRLFVPYAAASAVALYIVASVTGVESPLNRVVLALCGLAIAGMASTNYWVLADTDQGLVLCRSSRVRQYAKAIEQRLPDDTVLAMVGSTVITSDWKVADLTYTVTKRWESTLRQLSTR